MKWRQFFTPAQSLDINEAEKLISEHSAEEINIIDVRQPSEYEKGHIPGAWLIPLPDLPGRMDELDSEMPSLVYCAIGGRSRVAVQMLDEEGYKAFNLSGGIKAWTSKTAVGPQDLGIHLFKGSQSPAEILNIAFSLEQGLENFYILLEKNAKNKKVKDLFSKLSRIEIQHQHAIHKAYNQMRSDPVDWETFKTQGESQIIEGGLSSEEYIALFNPDLNSEVEVISLAMSIEAQAIDLYHRALRQTKTPEAKKIIQNIADEEKEHIKSLGRLMDSL